MSHLRDYLEREGSVNVGQLETAARRQQIYGGSLDTCLLELGYLAPEDVDRVLANACGLPAVPADALASGPARPIDRVPPDLLQSRDVFPLSIAGDRVAVAVHPELADERLGQLFRRVPGVQPMVTPECRLVRLFAEHEGSVAPQRYAVLCAKLDERGRTTAGIGTSARPEPAQEAPPEPSAASRSIDDTVPAQPAPGPALPSQETTLPPPAEPRARAVEPRSLRAAVAGARAVLESARQRDAATDALTRCLMIIAPRVALFGVRRDGLMAIRTPCEELQPALDGVVPIRENSDLERALAGTQRLDRVADLDLRLTVGLETAVPCLFEPVRVRDRPVLVAYVDREGGTFHPEELEVGRELCATAGRTLEEVLRLRRSKGPSGPSASTPSTAPPGLAQPSMSQRTRADDGQPAQPQPQPQPREPWRVPTEATPPPATEAPVEDPEHRVWSPPPGSVPAPEPDAPQTDAVVQRRPSPGASHTIPMIHDDGAPTPRFEPPPQRTAGADGAPLPLTNPLPADPPPVRTGTEPGRPSPLHPRSGPIDIGAAEASADVQLPKLVDAPPAPELPRLVDQRVSHRGPTLYSEAAPPPPRERPSTHRTIPAGELPRPRTEGRPDDLDDPVHPTIDASPPPPVLPPPPDAGMVTRSRRPKTLSGLPSETGLDSLAAGEEPSTGSIISLSSPIEERSSRGRIEIEDEDRVAPTQPPTATQAGIDELLDALSLHGDLEPLRKIGPPAFIRLAKRFPGPLDILRRDLAALPPPSAHGPLVRAAIQLGGDIVPYLIELFEAPSPDARFYGAFVFQELRDSRCLTPLASLAFDPDSDVRVIAMRVLETYSRSRGFGESAAIVRAELDSQNRTRQLHAARAVGTLRDVNAIEQLVELLSSKDRFTQEAALESLCSITGQQHGLKPHRWRQWFIENGVRHRVEWIIDSLKHKELPVRRWAYDELVRITGHRIAFQPSGDRREREVAARAWLSWWTTEGRERVDG